MVWKVSGCCCMNLRVAGYVHGVVSIALIVLGFILTVLRLNNSQIQKIGEYELDPKKLAAYYFVSYATDALVSGSMIIGISTNKHLMLLPWLILRAIGLITMAPIIMILMVVGIFLSFQNPAGLMVVAVALFIGLIVDNNPPPPRDYVFRPIVSSLALEIFTLVMYLFNAVVTALSLHGIYKNKHVMMLPYIILSGLGLIVTVPYLALIFIAAPYSNGPQIIGTIIAALLCAVMLGLMAWCWIVIYSLYHKIRDSVNKPMSYPYDI